MKNNILIKKDLLIKDVLTYNCSNELKEELINAVHKMDNEEIEETYDFIQIHKHLKENEKRGKPNEYI